jgi:hypothetical protein
MAKASSVVGNRRARVPRENIIDAIDGRGAAIADVMWGRRRTAAPARCVLREPPAVKREAEEEWRR